MEKIITKKDAIMERTLAALSLLFPWAGTISAIILLHKQPLQNTAFITYMITVMLTMLGIELGFHRYFAHKSYETYPIIAKIMGILGSMTFQGPLVFWVGIHRLHHQHADGELDPHSPKPRGKGFFGITKGLLHAYVLWTFRFKPGSWKKLARDLYKNPTAFFVNHNYFYWLGLGLLLPAIIGAALTQTLEGTIQTFLWGGPVRILTIQQFNYFVNVFNHTFGSRKFATKDNSKDHPLLCLVTLGAALHNHHHAHPRAAIMSLKPTQPDIGGIILLALKKLNCAWDVRFI